MEETRKRRWDVALGIVGPIITVIGLLVGVWQFTAGERAKVRLENDLQTRKDVVEFQRKLWLERLDAYKAIVMLAGRIAALADGVARDRAAGTPPRTDQPNLDALWRELTAAYWGQKLFLEDDGVTPALRDFYDTVRDFRDDWADANKVKVKADALATACHAAIRRGAPLGALP